MVRNSSHPVLFRLQMICEAVCNKPLQASDRARSQRPFAGEPLREVSGDPPLGLALPLRSRGDRGEESPRGEPSRGDRGDPLPLGEPLSPSRGEPLGEPSSSPPFFFRHPNKRGDLDLPLPPFLSSLNHPFFFFLSLSACFLSYSVCNASRAPPLSFLWPARSPILLIFLQSIRPSSSVLPLPPRGELLPGDLPLRPNGDQDLGDLPPGEPPPRGDRGDPLPGVCPAFGLPFLGLPDPLMPSMPSAFIDPRV